MNLNNNCPLLSVLYVVYMLFREGFVYFDLVGKRFSEISNTLEFHTLASFVSSHWQVWCCIKVIYDVQQRQSIQLRAFKKKNTEDGGQKMTYV